LTYGLLSDDPAGSSFKGEVNVMTRISQVVFGVALACGCGGGNGPAITGLYSVTETTATGNCKGPFSGTATDTFTLYHDANGTEQATLVASGLNVTGTVVGSTWTASANLTENVDAGAGLLTETETVGTLQYSYAFTNSGLTGVLVLTESNCSETINVTGTLE
jgi:hypothetical protein